MKNKIIAAGLVVVGAAGLQTCVAAGSDAAAPKLWNVSGTLRGFYDDNYNSSSEKKGSFGVEASPSVSLNVPLRQTDVGLRYTYGFYYYEKRDHDYKGADSYDQTHQVDVWLDHSFNERWKGNVRDTFAAGQEPELLGTSVSTPGRVNGNNLANHGTVTLDTEWTRLFGTTLTYGNDFYDYENKGGSASSPSRAGLLNRVEQDAAIDLKWTLQAETIAFVGYKIGFVNYTGNEDIGNGLTPGDVYRSDDRNSISHYGYVGMRHNFTANLVGEARGGVQYRDNYNDSLSNSGNWSPYADVSASYTYAQGSYVHLGFTHSLNATDVGTVNAANGTLTQDQESSAVTLDINHSITQNLIASVIGRAAFSSYNGGAYDGKVDQVYGVGVNLHYQINQHFGVDAGYNYDDLSSDVANRGYTRNRVYLGIGANY